MPYDKNAIEIEALSLCDGPQIVDTGSDIVKHRWPWRFRIIAIGIHAPVFKIPDRRTGRLEFLDDGLRRVGLQRVIVLPVAAMDDNQYGPVNLPFRPI